MNTWIKDSYGDGWNDYTDLTCPSCKHRFKKVVWPSEWIFCPHCGERRQFVNEQDKDISEAQG